MRICRWSAGFSLVELVVALSILAIALPPVILFLARPARMSADPVLSEQGGAIAAAYLEEILLNGFCDPSFDPDGNPDTGCPLDCRVSVCSGGCGGAIGVPETRASFDDICDYDGLVDNGARDQFGRPVSGLDAYTVSVKVLDNGVNLGGLSSDLGETARVEITVTREGMDPITVSGWRVNH